MNTETIIIAALYLIVSIGYFIGEGEGRDFDAALIISSSLLSALWPLVLIFKLGQLIAKL